ncbi:MAG TPA: protein kinase [Candidatus Xenobia bacterium]
MEPQSDATVPVPLPGAVPTTPPLNIPGYELDSVLGEGAYGQVWKARQVQTGQAVAVKILFGGVDIATLAREVARMANVGEHPHVASLFDGNLDHVPPYLVTPLLRGSLADAARPSVAQAATWFEQMVEGLGFVHRHGIIHCDLKPGNVLLDGEGQIRVVDFGQASPVGEDGLHYGTFWYMPAEQARFPDAPPPDVTWDIYALGATMYGVLTGTRARSAPEQDRMLAAQADVVAKLTWYSATLPRLALTPLRRINPAVDADLAAIVTHCLEIDPGLRYQSMGEVQADLRRRRERQPLQVRRHQRAYVAGRFLLRHAVVLGIVAASLMVMGVGLVRYIQGIRAAHQAEAQARRRAQVQLAALEFEKGRQAHDGTGLLWLGRAADDDVEQTRYKVAVSLALQRQPRLVALMPSEGPLWKAVLSPDGRVVATASDDGNVRLFDAAGTPLGAPIKLGSPVFAVAFSPDGQRVAGGALDGSIRIWHVPSGQPVTPVLRHGRRVLSVAFSPDGRELLSASDDHTAQVWDATTGALRLTVRHHDRVMSAVFSPDGTRFLTASRDRTAQQWDARTGRPLGAALRSAGRLESAAYSPEGRHVVTTSDDGTARLDGRIMMHHDDIVNGAWFSPDGTRLATASRDGTARIWAVSDGRPLTPPLRHGDWVWTARWSPDGRFLVTASRDRTAQVWDAATGTPVGEPLPHPDRVATAEFSPDGRRILTAADDGQARLWNMPAALPDRLEGDSGPLGGVREGLLSASEAVSHDLLATAGSDGKVHLSHADGRPLTHVAVGNAPVTWVGFSPDGRWLGAGDDRGQVLVWDCQQARVVFRQQQQTQRILWGAFNPNGSMLATVSMDKTAEVWTCPGGRSVNQKPLRASDRVVFCCWNPDGHHLLTTSFDKSARLYVLPGSDQPTLRLTHHGSVLRAAFSPDGTRLVTGGSDGVAQIWDVSSGQLLFRLPHGDRVQAVAFSPDGRRLATGSDDGTAVVWDAATGRPFTAPLAARGPVTQVGFSADGDQLFAMSDQVLQRWNLRADLDEPAALLDLETSVWTGFSLSPDGLVTACSPQQFHAELADWQNAAPGHAATCRWQAANLWQAARQRN